MIKVTQIILMIFLLVFCGNILAFNLQAQASAVSEAIGKVGEVERRAGLAGGSVGEDAASIQIKIGDIINILMGLTSTIALIVFFYGGIMWMLAEGSSDKISKAKRTMIWAAIGLVAIFMSGAALRIVYSFGGVLWPRS